MVNDFVDNQTLKLSAPAIVAEGLVAKGQLVSFEVPCRGLRSVIPWMVQRRTARGRSFMISHYRFPGYLHTRHSVQAGMVLQCSDRSNRISGGLHPVSATLLKSPDKQYPGDGGATLINGRKGFLDVYREPSWLGYREQPMEALFDFGEKGISVSLAGGELRPQPGSYIFPPAEVEVFAGMSADKRSIGDHATRTTPKREPTHMVSLSIPLKGASYRYYKLMLKPVAKLPQWHSARAVRDG